MIQQHLEVLDRIPVFPEFEAAAERDVYILDGDHRAILAQLDDPVSHLVTFLYWTGWRVGSRGDEGAPNLTWDQAIHWSRTAHPYTSKNARTRSPRPTDSQSVAVTRTLSAFVLPLQRR